MGALAISRSDVTERPIRSVRRQQIRSGIGRVDAQSAAEGHAVLVGGEGWTGDDCVVKAAREGGGSREFKWLGPRDLGPAVFEAVPSDPEALRRLVEGTAIDPAKELARDCAQGIDRK